jgi:hypothetical protein
MGFFSRAPRTIDPVPTHLDVAWFRNWIDEIIRESGVDPANDANGIALLWMAGRSTEAAGADLMDRYDGAWAKPILADYMRTDGATPWGAIELIAGWDRNSVPVLEENLVSLAKICVEVGPADDGEFKTFG